MAAAGISWEEAQGLLGSPALNHTLPGMGLIVVSRAATHSRIKETLKGHSLPTCTSYYKTLLGSPENTTS